MFVFVSGVKSLKILLRFGGYLKSYSVIRNFRLLSKNKVRKFMLH